MKLALFDFDGTITTKDSYREFLRFLVGDIKFAFGVIILSPVLIAFKAGLITNQTAKQKVTRWFLKGFSKKKFVLKAQEFVIRKLPKLIKSSALERLEWHKSHKHRIILVSASFEDYLKYWAKLHQIELIATKLEWKKGRVSGRFATKNCWGPEKVRRIKEFLDTDDFEEIYAYGDSEGDKEMLELAHHAEFRFFN
jgi:HAD superfamily hydrolase (TIGR01490 family)